MRNGGAPHVMATWHMLISGVICMTLGFPAIFQFFRPYFLNLIFLSFLSSLFPISLIIALSYFFFVYSCDYSDLVPATSFEFFSNFAVLFQGVFLFSSSSISVFFVICYKFLIFPFLFLCCGCFCFLAFGILVFTSFYCVFSRCPWLVALRLE